MSANSLLTARQSPPGAPQTPRSTHTRREQTCEILWELEQVFLEPGCFGSFSVDEAAETLEAEFTAGPWRDEEIVSRLEKLREAEAAGRVKDAARHLHFVRRKMRRLGLVPVRSEPLGPGANEYPAWRRPEGRAS